VTTVFLSSATNWNIASTTTTYNFLGTTASPVNTVLTEANTQTAWRNSGTFSNLYARIGASAASSTLNYRTGGASGNQTIAIAVGEFTDTTHTDSVSAGDLVNFQVVNSAGPGTISVAITGIQFSPTTTTNTINKFGCSVSLVDTSVGATYYNPVVGALSLNTTEANAQFTNKVAATLQNLYVFVSANTVAVATVKSRIGGVNGNLTVSITSGTTGSFEDTTHTDSITVGNLINTATNATAVTSLTITNIAVDYLNTTNQTHYLSGLATGATFALSSTSYNVIGGSIAATPTEANRQLQTGLTLTASNLQAFVRTNGVTANSVITFRVATAAGNQSITYGSGVTGYQEDTTHTDAVTSSQEIDYQVVVGGTGTNINLGNIGILATFPATLAAVSWYPAYAAEVKPGPKAAQYTLTAIPVIPSPITQTNWYPVYNPTVNPTPLRAGYNLLVNRIIPSPITQNNWYPVYSANVKAGPNNTAGTATAPIPAISAAVTVLNWFPTYATEVKLAPKAAGFSYFAEQLASPIAINNWLPNYDAKVSVKVSGLSGSVTPPIPAIAATTTLNNWYPIYSPDLAKIAAIAQCVTVQPLNLIVVSTLELLGGKAYDTLPYQRHAYYNYDEKYERLKHAEKHAELRRIDEELAAAQRRKDEELQAKLAAEELAALEAQLQEEISRLRTERAWLMRLIDDEEAIFVLLLSSPLN
jgi:hypothetical protein